ncbi:MAG: hypothetical protein MJ241_04380 [Bacilli bacterium]|nr:hypothetical protein [Bacilli bacterium]
MGITWFSAKEKLGQASLYDSNITLNMVASVPFDVAYKVQVGVDDDKNLIIEPISKERVVRGDLDEYSLLPIQLKKSYSRINSTSLMKKISAALGIELSKTPVKFDTKWDDESNMLIIMTGKAGE